MSDELIARWMDQTSANVTALSCRHWTFTVKVDLGTSPPATFNHKCTSL